MLLSLLFVSLSLNLTTPDFAAASRDSLSLSVFDVSPVKGSSGYYFSLASTPLTQNEYVFIATPLKKGYFFINGKKIVVEHTITVKERKGFTIYFSGEQHNAQLTIRQETKGANGVMDYNGVLAIQNASENHKFKVHGNLYP